MSRYRLDGIPERYLVREGDVLFRSRGERNTATALDHRLAEPALAVLPIVVLRPEARCDEPMFLGWAINQPPAQSHFDSTARGTGLRMVPKSSLDDLEIDVPDLATQRAIVEVDRLATEEQQLTSPPRQKYEDSSSSRLLVDLAKTSRPPADLKDDPMTDQLTQQQVNQTAWAACDTFRGVVDAGQYKDYILVMLFLKYISDLWNDHVETLPQAVSAATRPGSAAGWSASVSSCPRAPASTISTKRGTSQHRRAASTSRWSRSKTPTAPSSKACSATSTSTPRPTSAASRTATAGSRTCWRTSPSRRSTCARRASTEDIIGECYIYLISRFASDAGKKAGEFYTPAAVSRLLAKLAAPKPGDTICDPACGSGSLLIRAAEEVGVRELRPLRPGSERRDLGARAHEHVSPRQGRRPHRVVRHAQQPARWSRATI